MRRGFAYARVTGYIAGLRPLECGVECWNRRKVPARISSAQACPHAGAPYRRRV